jgi:cytochrome bd-type quinol oxidase subunit 1
MKEVFKKLLDSFVKENNPKIDSIHLYNVGSLTAIMYVVQVRSYYTLEKDDRENIRKDVDTVFNSIGFSPASEYMITYRRAK